MYSIRFIFFYDFPCFGKDNESVLLIDIQSAFSQTLNFSS